MPTPKPVTSSSKTARENYKKVPTRTPADDPGRYSKTPHDYGDALIRPCTDKGPNKGKTRLGGSIQRDLIYWIERETWGKNVGSSKKIERPEWAKLSLTTFAQLVGSDRRTVARNLADLAERGIIAARDRHGCGPTVAKMYQLTPEKWRAAPWYEPKAVEDPEDVPAEEEEDEDTHQAENAESSPEATAAPGKVSRPQPVSISPTAGAPAVPLFVIYKNLDVPFPLSFTARPGKAGRIQISCRATALHRFAYSSPIVSPVTVDSGKLNDVSPSHKSVFASPSPINSPLPVESEAFIDYRQWTETFLLNFWGKPLDEPLFQAIVSAAGAAPLATFERIVLARFKRQRTGKGHSTGLLIELAKDAKRAHDAERGRNWRAAADSARAAAPKDELPPAEDWYAGSALEAARKARK